MDSVVRFTMVLSNAVFVVTIFGRSSVISQACVQVSARLSPMKVAGQSQYLILYTAPSALWLLSVLDVGWYLPLGRYRFCVVVRLVRYFRRYR